MNSSSVYSIGDSIYKKATQLYNDYISSERAHKERMKDMLQEISHGEIIFSKNNVCIHTSEQSRWSSSSSAGACGNNCLPGYFSIKLIKSQPDEANCTTDELAKANNLIRSKDSQVNETSFIIKKEFDLKRETSDRRESEPVNGLNKMHLNEDTGSPDNVQSDLESIDARANQAKTNLSAYLKQPNDSQGGRKQLSPYHSMVITWMPNLIFEEKPNQLTRNLSLRSTNHPSGHLKRRQRSKSLGSSTARQPGSNQANYHNVLQHNFHRLDDQDGVLRSYASDFRLNPVSNSHSDEENAVDAENLIFRININQIKSLKLFFGSRMAGRRENGESECGGKDGQLVITNHDLRLKIFHFHNGGLSKLEQFLSDWCFVFCLNQKSFSNGLLSFFESIYEEPFVVGDNSNSLLDFYTNKFIQMKNQKAIEKEYNNNEVNCIQLYTVNLPALSYLDLQNECSTYKPVGINSLEEYNQFFSADGQLIYDFDKFKTRVFFSGVEPSSRKYFYPYLLNRFAVSLTTKEKNEIIQHGQFLYRNIDERRRRMSKDDKFYPKFVQYKQTVSVDLPRTDRNNKELQDKKTLKMMERILLNYTLYSNRIGYTQGFSDLLAPLALILKHEPESEIFFNFVYLIEKKGFFCLPNDDSIDSCMAKIRELLRVLNPKLYHYFKQKGDAFQMLFTHRWMLVCFRREFGQDAGLRIWEACWTDFSIQFQLFVCIAIIQIYGQSLVEKEVNSDDILLYFSTLSQKMNADLVLKKARGNLFQFRSLTKIPCTLKSLCNLKSKPNSLSDWTTQLQPSFECIRSADNADTLILCTCDNKPV